MLVLSVNRMADNASVSMLTESRLPTVGRGMECDLTVPVGVRGQIKLIWVFRN